jgi:uncharacterized repeat protein (TIGR01451 family)
MRIDVNAVLHVCRNLALASFALLGLIALGQPVAAQGTYINQVKLSAADGDEEDYLGSAVAASGNYIAAGVPYDWDGLSFGPGSVNVFRSASFAWSETQKLEPTDGAADDEFGLALAMRDSILFIGAPGHAQRRGAVYVYQLQNDSWQFVQKLLAADGSSGHAFGGALAFDGQHLVVGANAFSASRGAAYVFALSGTTWSQTQKLVAADASPGDSFGSALAIEGNRLAVGARLDDNATAGDNRGSVYVYTDAGGGFSSPQKLSLADGRDSDQFGSSLGLVGSNLLVGTPFRDRGTGEDNSGAVHHFRLQGGSWVLHSTLVDPLATNLGALGSSLAVRGNSALIGAPVGNNTAGFALHFELVGDTWEPWDRFVADDTRPFEYFGKSVALSEQYAAIGAELADVGANVEQGAIYAHLRAATQTALSVSPSPSLIGQSLAVSVSVLSDLATPDGSVLIESSEGSSCIASLSAGTGSCALPGHALGIKSISAHYHGSIGLAASSAQREHRVRPDLAVLTTSLPKGKIGRAYSQVLLAQPGGATAPLQFSLSSGALPPGFSLASDGTLSGTTLQAGNYSFMVQVTDASGAELGGPFVATRALSLEVDPAFSTTLVLQTGSTTGDRGQQLVVAAVLDVVEPEGTAPAGTYLVTATNGASVVSCSSPVTSEGLQQCSLAFGFSVPQGVYAVSARFQPSAADYGSSEDSGDHTLLRAVDVAVSMSADREFIRPNDLIVYSVEVTNLGIDSAAGAAVQILPSVGLTELSWTCVGAACPSASGLGPVAAAIDIGVDQSALFALRGRALSPLPASIQTNASVLLPVGSFQRETDPSNNATSHVVQALTIFGNGFED